MKTPFHKRSIQVFIYLSMIIAFLFFMSMAVFNSYSTITFVMFIILAFVCFGLIITNIIFGTFGNMVNINETGVHFKLKKKSLHMNWKSIRMIAVSEYGLGKSSKRVVFSSKYDKNILRIIYPYSALSNNLLFMQNRKGLIKKIEVYWDKEITNKGENSY